MDSCAHAMAEQTLLLLYFGRICRSKYVEAQVTGVKELTRGSGICFV